MWSVRSVWIIARWMSRALRFYSSGRLSTTRALPHDDEITDAARALLCGLQPFSGIGNDRSIGSQRLQEHNHLGTVLGRCEPAIRLHVIAGHDLIGCRDEAIELLLVPYKVRALHGAGIAVVLEGTGFPSDNIVEVRTQAIVAFLGRVAGPACVVECLLPRLGGGALSRRLFWHGRETQKHQECGADQSRDCGAGHKCSCRLNARSQRFVPVIPARCLATVWATVRDLGGFAAANDLVGAFANISQRSADKRDL